MHESVGRMDETQTAFPYSLSPLLRGSLASQCYVSTSQPARTVAPRVDKGGSS